MYLFHGTPIKEKSFMPSFCEHHPHRHQFIPLWWNRKGQKLLLARRPRDAQSAHGEQYRLAFSPIKDQQTYQLGKGGNFQSLEKFVFFVSVIWKSRIRHALVRVHCGLWAIRSSYQVLWCHFQVLRVLSNKIWSSKGAQGGKVGFSAHPCARPPGELSFH